MRGRHNIKAGVDYRWTRYANYQSAFAGGTLAFDTGFTRMNYLTQDALKPRGIGVDIAAFTDAMDRQRAKARASWAGSGEAADGAVWFCRVG